MLIFNHPFTPLGIATALWACAASTSKPLKKLQSSTIKNIGRSTLGVCEYLVTEYLQNKAKNHLEQDLLLIKDRRVLTLFSAGITLVGIYSVMDSSIESIVKFPSLTESIRNSLYDINAIPKCFYSLASCLSLAARVQSYAMITFHGAKLLDMATKPLEAAPEIIFTRSP